MQNEVSRLDLIRGDACATQKRHVGFLSSNSTLGEPFTSVWKEVSGTYIAVFQQECLGKAEMQLGVMLWGFRALWVIAAIFHGFSHLAAGHLLTTTAWALPKLPVVRGKPFWTSRWLSSSWGRNRLLILISSSVFFMHCAAFWLICPSQPPTSPRSQWSWRLPPVYCMVSWHLSAWNEQWSCSWGPLVRILSLEAGNHFPFSSKSNLKAGTGFSISSLVSCMCSHLESVCVPWCRRSKIPFVKTWADTAGCRVLLHCGEVGDLYSCFSDGGIEEVSRGIAHNYWRNFWWLIWIYSMWIAPKSMWASLWIFR